VEDVTKCAGDVSLLNVLHLDWFLYSRTLHGDSTF
jgi:hypothetical protein